MPSSNNQVPMSRPRPVGIGQQTHENRDSPEGKAADGSTQGRSQSTKSANYSGNAELGLVDVSKSLGNKRVSSPNVGNWDPDVRLLQSSDRWIGAYGLKKLKLELQQILPTIGFKHSDDFVESLKKPISARYSDGLFTRFPYKDGTVYNLIATRDKLKIIEKQLHQAISLYRKRLDWLTSESRRIFGVIEEKCISIVLDVQASNQDMFDMYIQSLIQVIKEQVLFISKLNLIRVAVDADCWQERVTSITLESVDSALDWILEQEMTTPTSASSTTEAILKAMSDDDVEAVYLYTEGNASVASQELLKRKLKECGKQLNVVSFNCKDPSTITYLKTLNKIGGGRFHAFSVYEEADGNHYEKSLTHRDPNDGDSGFSSDSKSKKKSIHSIGFGVRDDVMKVWEELDTARNTVAEIQALIVEFENPQKAKQAIAKAQIPKKTVIQKEERGELYMSSKQWLARHGLKAKKLIFYDFLQSLAFKHCDGVVDIQHAPKRDVGNAVVKQKLVNARYCERFAHVRWKDGELMHVHVSGPMHRNYEERILAAVESYRKRMEWLQQGSRELFGTIIENQVAILIDTSSSIASRLFLIKDKLYRLMQEQLRHKRKFNILKFDSRVQPWRDHLVDCNSHNLENAWQWVKSLTTGGSTNTLSALKRALADSQVEAVYLLTDGRPDQPPSTVLAQAALINTVPIHTISFNCADSEANEFLSQLSADTGGRFHYFSEDGYDSKGPRPFESEDLRLLREEIEKGLSDLQKVNGLRDECTKLDWKASEKEKSSRSRLGSSRTPERPQSAFARIPNGNPAMPISSGIRARPGSARASSHVTNYSLRSSSRSSQSPVLTPSPPVATNRASQLRISAGKTQESRDDWVLPETREYLERSQGKSSRSRVSQKGSKKKRKVRSRSPASSMRRWLKKNSLEAKKLTILDALAPTMIPHTTKYVPILDKHVLSKVFDQVLPLAHTSGKDRTEVQIINPQAANLASYEEKLKSMIELYKRKLSEFVFPALSTTERLKYNGDGIPSFEENKESIIQDLEANDWPISLDEIQNYEKEMQRAELYLSQAKELQETAGKLSKEALERQREQKDESPKKSNLLGKVSSQERLSNIRSASSTRHLRNQRVIGRSALDGFYYPGIVARCLNSRYLEVDFDNGDRQVTSVRYVIPIGGARPCPTLKAGDYVFVKSRLPSEINDDQVPEFDFCYVPGIVQVTPLRHRSASKCYTVLKYSGTKVTILRNDMVKITRSRFIFACRFIRDAVVAAHKGSSPAVIYPSPERALQDEEALTSRASSVASSHHSSRSSRSSRSASSRSSNNDSLHSSPPKSPGSARSNSSNRNSSSDSSKNSSKSVTPIVTPQGTPRSVSPANQDTSRDQEEEIQGRVMTMLDEFKKAMEDKYLRQVNELDEERKRLEELHENLLQQQEDQKKNQVDIEEQQRKLQDKHQELLQRQLDQQHENQKRLLEDQNKLHQQQEELLHRQKSQHDQLLQSQLNQSRSLNLQYLQLVNKRPKAVKDQEIETENNGKDQETETVYNSEDKHTETERSDSRDSQTSPMSSRKSSVVNDQDDGNSDNEKNESRAQIPNDGTEENAKTEDPTPGLTMFIGDDSEAVLITKGDHGLLVSRRPPEEDPAVVAQDIPQVLNEGEEILARWADDGWYYRGTIKEDCGEALYMVEDSVGNVEKIVRGDIISDEDDANNVINTGDTVVALHPGYPYSYAPGVILHKLNESSMKVRFYDSQEAVVPREEMYMLSAEKFERDCAYIVACEDGLVGQAVVARNDEDGQFHLGAVRERVSGPRSYLVEWADQKLQIQNYSYIFGAHTKRRQFGIDDCILAIADTTAFTYLPGKVTEDNGEAVTVKFCNGTTIPDIDPLQSYWISPDYYKMVSEYFLKRTIVDERDQPAVEIDVG